MVDKKISEMAELLCRGVKMLSYHCPECNVPLFRNGDKIFCPVCGREAIFESELERVRSLGENLKEEVAEKSTETKSEIKDAEIRDKFRTSTDTGSVRRVDAKFEVPQEIRGSGTDEEPVDSALKSIQLTISRLCKRMEGENEISSIEKEVKAEKLIITSPQT